MTRRGLGFTLLELMFSVLIFAMMGYVAWQMYVGGTKQTNAATEHLSAIQNALLLMETIQEDCRQVSVLNEYEKPIVPFSMLFSPNGKSFMMRCSTLRNTQGSDLGSSFIVVIYQLVKHPTMADAYYIRRIERTTDGRPIPGGNTRIDEEQAFRSMVLRDIRFDNVVRMENMGASRQYLRVSITATNTVARGQDPKVYFLSNVFEIPKPEDVYAGVGTNTPVFPKRFFDSTKWALGNGEVRAGMGYDSPLPPPEFPPQLMAELVTATSGLLGDYVVLGAGGRVQEVKVMDIPPTPGAVDPFNIAGSGLPAKRNVFVKGGVASLKNLLGSDFRGRILGQVYGPPAVRGGAPSFTEGYSMDATVAATRPLIVQLNNLLSTIIPKGPGAVAELGHQLLVPGSGPGNMITTAEAQAIISGQ